MRKTLFSLALAMAVLSSCSSDDIVNNPMNEENHSFPASRSLHENILSFSSEEEYNALLDSLGTLSDEELLQWESGQKGFTSMYRMHLSLIHISEPTRLGMISYAVFCLKKKNKKKT